MRFLPVLVRIFSAVAICHFAVSANAQNAGQKIELRAIATELLNPTKSAGEKDQIIAAHADPSAELILALVQQINVGTADEYRGIPYVWKIAIGAGKRNRDVELKEILSASLPKTNEPLHDWQSVVIGGGIINGLSLIEIWPRERIEEILAGEQNLKARWSRSLQLAAQMADDEKIKAGTRYDALRLVGVTPWKTSGAQLTRYLAKGINAELQQGAVSGLADVDAPETADALLNNLENLTPKNLQFAFDALIRNDARIDKLLDSVDAGKIQLANLGAERLQKLKQKSKFRDRIEALQKKSEP